MRPSALVLTLALVLVAGCRSRSPAEPVERLSPSASPSPPRVTVAAALPAGAVETPTAPGCPAGFTCDFGALARLPPPKITELFVQKREHKLHLVTGKTIVKSYGVALGSGGFGLKRFEGDRVTPVGAYTITGRYPSRWHTYLSLSYPNEEDQRRFADLVARGEVDKRRGPGSAIAIHGHRQDQQDKLHKQRDWTLGCVALDNQEIDEIAAVAPVGTRVVIED